MKKVEKQFDISSEIRFCKLFDYRVLKLEKETEYKIINKENNRIIGHISYTTKNGNKGYFLEIDLDDEIEISRFREENDKEQEDSFEFYVKKQNEKIPVELNMGINPFLKMESSKYGNFQIRLGKEVFHFCFDSYTKNHHIFEDVITQYDWIEKIATYYKYTITYCNRNEKIDRKSNSLALEFFFKPKTTLQLNNQIQVYQEEHVQGRLINKNLNLVKGTIYEAAKKHKMGINAYKHFRTLLQEILPFKEDILLAMFEKRGVTEDYFQLFIPEYKPKKKENYRRILKK